MEKIRTLGLAGVQEMLAIIREENNKWACRWPSVTPNKLLVSNQGSDQPCPGIYLPAHDPVLGHRQELWKLRDSEPGPSEWQKMERTERAWQSLPRDGG